jgi:integrase
MSTLHIRVPRATRHASGQAVVRLSGKDHYLGKWGSPDARAKYKRLVAEWLAGGSQAVSSAKELTIAELALRYMRFAETYYVKDGRHTREVSSVRQTLRFVRELYGKTPAVDFGPLALKAVRQRIIEAGWCRKSVNQAVGRVKRWFKWAAENELVPGSTWQALAAVSGLRLGRTPGVHDRPPIKPVAIEWVEAVLPHVSPQVAALIRLQLLTAARPGELVQMKGADIETSGRVWVFRLGNHKTVHHQKTREIFLGPQAQEIIKPWLRLTTEEYLFQPQEAEARRQADRRTKRQTPMTPSQARRRRRRRPLKSPGLHYTTESYRRSITTACLKAGVPHWHPHQLRHLAATNLRREYGIELARIILGHSTAFTTEIYAEVDRASAVEVVAKVG